MPPLEFDLQRVEATACADETTQRAAGAIAAQEAVGLVCAQADRQALWAAFLVVVARHGLMSSAAEAYFCELAKHLRHG